MLWRGYFCVVVVVVVLLWAGSGLAQEQAAPAQLQQIAEALERSKLGELTLAEVQRFCEAKISQLPEVTNVTEWEAYASGLRKRILEEIVFRGVPAEWRTSPLRVEWLDLIPAGPGYRMRKLRYEALPGLWVPAILYEPETIRGKVPAVLNVNGHVSAGKQYPPKQIRCINMAKKGVIALNIEWVGMGQFHTHGYHHGRMNQLDLCGVSGLAVFYLNMQRGLDVLLSLETVDPTRVGMTGLSGGGWQTIVLSSLDTRITLANPVAGYSSFKTRVWHAKDLGDSEQTPTDLAALADYTHLTALLAPRPALLTYNAKDECCFEAGYALEPLVQAARPVYELYGKGDFLRTHVNYDPGTHNYERENREAFYRMLRDFFAPDPEAFDASELPSDGEVKSAEELFVPLPEGNHDFNSLARKFAAALPLEADIPADLEDFRQWQAQHRRAVKEIVRFREFTVHAHAVGEESGENFRAKLWRLVLDETFTTPVIEFNPVNGSSELSQSGRSAILLVREGDSGVISRDVCRYLEAGQTVLAIRPIGYGERNLNYLWHLMLASIGERTLGIQAAEIVASAVWWKSVNRGTKLRLVADGPRATLAVLLAAVAGNEVFDAMELNNPLGSIKDVIDNNWDVTSRPDFFCFGLLRVTDLPYLMAAVAPRPVTIRNAPGRLRESLSRLKTRDHIHWE